MPLAAPAEPVLIVDIGGGPIAQRSERDCGWSMPSRSRRRPPDRGVLKAIQATRRVARLPKHVPGPCPPPASSPGVVAPDIATRHTRPPCVRRQRDQASRRDEAMLAAPVKQFRTVSKSGALIRRPPTVAGSAPTGGIIVSVVAVSPISAGLGLPRLHYSIACVATAWWPTWRGRPWPRRNARHAIGRFSLLRFGEKRLIGGDSPDGDRGRASRAVGPCNQSLRTGPQGPGRPAPELTARGRLTTRPLASVST